MHHGGETPLVADGTDLNAIVHDSIVVLRLRVAGDLAKFEAHWGILASAVCRDQGPSTRPMELMVRCGFKLPLKRGVFYGGEVGVRVQGLWWCARKNESYSE